MEETTSREKILKKIRNALISKTENPYPSLDMDSSVYNDFTEYKDITFAEKFTLAGGKFIYCENESELRTNLQALVTEKSFETIVCKDPLITEILDKSNIQYTDKVIELDENSAGITQCEYLIARQGSIMVSSKQISGRRLNVFPETHIVIARTDQIVEELKEAFQLIKTKYQPEFPSLVSLITGPSRTADIEKTLVMGAHGPKDLYVLLMDVNS